MLVSDLPIVMIRSLIITLIIEGTLALLMKYEKKDLINILLVNILTNPLLNSLVVGINYYFGIKWRLTALIILEVIVIIIEGVIYQKYLMKRRINGYFLSLILNLASIVMGIFLNNLIY